MVKGSLVRVSSLPGVKAVCQRPRLAGTLQYLLTINFKSRCDTLAFQSIIDSCSENYNVGNTSSPIGYIFKSADHDPNELTGNENAYHNLPNKGAGALAR